MSAKKSTAVKNRRVHRRITVGLPMQVRGTDAAGQRFEDSVTSYDVSRTGASFSTARDLPLGSAVEVIIPQGDRMLQPASEFTSLARVVRVTKGDSQRERTVGVEFVGQRFHRVYVSETIT